MSGAVLLTGVTGFLGMDMLASLLEDGREVIAPIRAADPEQATLRLRGVMQRLYGTRSFGEGQVRAIHADMQSPGLGLSASDRRTLVASVESIVHCAGSISFGVDLDSSRAINVEGIRRMIGLAREISSKGELRRLLHVSTAYVCGRHEGVFFEEDLELGQEFRNPYEQSKYEAERLLAAATDLPTVLARPSIVVGHSESGWTSAFNVIYGPMRAFERGMLEEVPANPASIVDFVPIDYVSAGLMHLLDDPAAEGSYHLVAADLALSAGELALAQAELLGRPPMRLIPPEDGGSLPDGIATYAPYLDIRCRFDDARARSTFAAAGISAPAPADYLGRLIDYAQRTRWGKRRISRAAAFAAALR